MTTLMALNCIRNSLRMNGTNTEQLDVLDFHNKQHVLLSTMGVARLVKIHELITDSRMPPRKRMRVVVSHACISHMRQDDGQSLVRQNYDMSKAQEKS